MLREMPQALRSGRHYRRAALRGLLVLHCRESAVSLLFLGVKGGAGKGQGGDAQEAAAGAVMRGFCGRGLCALGLCGRGFGGRGAFGAAAFAQAVAYCPVPAGLKAVEARHAAAVIHLMLLAVDAGSLALARAQAAAVAFVFVNIDAQQREAREHSQHRADRANRIAPGPAAAPREYENQHEGERSCDEGRKALEPDFRRIERVAVKAFRQQGKHVVSEAIERREEVAHYPSESAVRGKQAGERGGACDHRDDKQGEQAIAQPVFGRRIGQAVFLPFAAGAQAVDKVLHHSERTDYRAIYPAEYQGEDDQDCDGDEVEREHRRQQLDFGHPSQPGVQHSGEIAQQDGYPEKENQREAPPHYCKNISHLVFHTRQIS